MATAPDVEIRRDVVYARHDGVDLAGDLFLPAGAGPYPVLVGVHGGGWRRGSRTNFNFWGPYLAARGYAVFAVSYRFARPDWPSFPGAIHDIRAAVQFVKGEAAALRLDPARVALVGDSAGAHLASFVALAGDEPAFTGGYPGDAHAALSTKVKVLIGNYGVYDLSAHWNFELIATPGASSTAPFLGAQLSADRRRYFEASPISYVTTANAGLAVLLSYGTEDWVVDRATQSEAFLKALLQAGCYVRTVVVQGEGHFYASEPIDEPGSASGRLAPRLVRFLADRL